MRPQVVVVVVVAVLAVSDASGEFERTRISRYRKRITVTIIFSDIIYGSLPIAVRVDGHRYASLLITLGTESPQSGDAMYVNIALLVKPNKVG